MTVASKRKQKIRNVIRGGGPSGLKTQKKDTHPRYVEHEWRRGLKRKSLKMDDANYAAD